MLLPWQLRLVRIQWLTGPWDTPRSLRWCLPLVIPHPELTEPPIPPHPPPCPGLLPTLQLLPQGAHSLVCTATYVTPDGERRVQGQAFSFTAANPLIVRTKVRRAATTCGGWVQVQRRNPSHPTSSPKTTCNAMRARAAPSPACRTAPPHPPSPSHLQQRTVGDAVLLEASLENATRAPMLLDAISFFTLPPWSAERIGGGGAATLPPPPAGSSSGAAAEAGPLRCATVRCWQVRAGCCSL